MKLPIFKQNLVSTLWANVEANYELYMNGGFADFLANSEFQGQERDVEGLFLREEDLVNLSPESGGINDAHNANIVFSAFENMTPNHAFDERIWVAITHTIGFDWTRKRWLRETYSKEKNLQGIKSHFFARVGGSRGIHRNNAFSSLWWWAYVTKRGSADDFANRLRIFLQYTDLRASIMERPVSSRTPQVFQAIMTCVINKLKDDPETTFFSRKRVAGDGPYREWMKKVNLLGGRQLYSAHTVEELVGYFSEFMAEIEKKISD